MLVFRLTYPVDDDEFNVIYALLLIDQDSVD
jgi:hypothetical protein